MFILQNLHMRILKTFYIFFSFNLSVLVVEFFIALADKFLEIFQGIRSSGVNLVAGKIIITFYILYECNVSFNGRNKVELILTIPEASKKQALKHSKLSLPIGKFDCA